VFVAFRSTWQQASLHLVPMAVHREQNVKREDQQDETIRCFLLTFVLTCFEHHYAHLQESKGPVTAFGVLFWFCWITNHIQQNQNNTPNAVTGPLFLLKLGIMMPETC